MPVYEVFHIIDLSLDQRDRLAEGITRIHSEAFTTPKLFVNVNFHDDVGKSTYVGGKRKATNRIIASVRHGPSRSQEDYDGVCSEIAKLWGEVVDDVDKNPRHELRAIFIVGGLVAGAEAGYPIPQAGEDRQWLERHIESFKERADGGDEDFVDMLVDIKGRKAFEGIVGDWKSEEEVKKEKEAKKKEERGEGDEGGAEKKE